MRWLRRATKLAEPAPTPTVDPTMAALMVRADLIMKELDIVVPQMNAMLRERVAKE